jgi:protoporphyrinogen oxidase
MNDKCVVIIGAGPAGLTAAYELSSKGFSNIVILEATDQVGGLSRTVNHNGNRIDIGGHRFFSKSGWVMKWWLDRVPLAGPEEPHTLGAEHQFASLAYQGRTHQLHLGASGSPASEGAMLVRNRLSRILFAGKLFDYPLKLNLDTALKLGPLKCLLFGMSYLKVRLFPRPKEETLEDFFINRFGRRLYLQFFKEYTEKVWGKACSEISAAWGAQRIKSLSVGKALLHAIKQPFKRSAAADQTSLIEHFLYPRLGPGQMWEATAAELALHGITVRKQAVLDRITVNDENIVTGIEYRDCGSGQRVSLAADVVISTMPVKDLVAAMGDRPPLTVREVASALEYRDFMTVGLLYRKNSMKGGRKRAAHDSLGDNWIYVQEPGVKVGRLQVFNNWSPYMVADPETSWVGLEFFCSEGDELWNRNDEALLALARREMVQIGLADTEECLDGIVIRMPKAYPGYYGAYDRFDEIRSYTDTISNLFLIGRNGMHRYNNQDHSMLTAKLAAEAIAAGSDDKKAIWEINVDDDYHEQGSEATPEFRSSTSVNELVATT